MVKLYISPHPSEYGEDGRGSGGIWRVISAQAKYLPESGVEIVDKAEDADVVNIHAGSLVETGAPVVQSCHGYYWTGDFQWERTYWEFNSAVVEGSRRATEIIVPSEWVAYPIQRDMRRVPHVIQHGIDIEDFEPAKDNHGYVLWAKPRVDVVSDPAPMNELAKITSNIQFLSTFGRPAANVGIIGARTYLAFQDILKHAIVWLATVRETGDIASREAMAYGIPVLGWDWGATGELVQHGETGYLAKPGDYRDLKEGLYYCLENQERLGAAGRDYIIKHGQWKDIIPRYAEVYHQAIEINQYPVKVSVVVPTHNYAHFLPECLTSILNQDMFDYEVVIVDDGSTDATSEVLALYEQFENIRIIQQDNQGLSGALNTGHRAARGKYIINCDPDNILPSNTLQILSTAMDEDPWLDVVGGGLSIYSPDGNHRQATDWPWGTVDPQMQLNHYNQLHSSSMMRARSIKRLGGYRQRQHKNEDGELWCRAVSAGLRFKQVTDEPTLVYRWHDDNKSKTEGGEDDPEGPLSWNFHYPWRKRLNITPYAMTGQPQQQASRPVRSYDMPHISVVIACGPNHDRYLPDALDSVIGQTFQRFECIVANDTGHDIDVVAMGHPWVTVINTGRQGPARARNAAIAVAKAPLIVPLDADDMLYPKALELLYSAWLQKRDNLVYADCFTEDSPGHRKLYHSGPWSWEKIEKEAIYQVTILYAKQWWEAVGGYDDDVPWEDWVFGIKLHHMGIGATYVEEPWGVYRHWTGRKSDEDAADFGTAKFKERLDRVYEQIKEKRMSRSCQGCGKRAQPRRANQASLGQPQPDTGPDVLMVFKGHRSGGFSLNSRAQRGKKYRIFREEPFIALAGDAKWIKTLEFFEVVERNALVSEVPAQPPTPPTIQTQSSEAPGIPPEPESEPEPQPEPKPEPPPLLVTTTTLNADDIPGVSERMALAMKAMGIGTIEGLWTEFQTNGNARLKMIKGLKDKRLETLREFVKESVINA